MFMTAVAAGSVSMFMTAVAAGSVSMFMTAVAAGLVTVPCVAAVTMLSSDSACKHDYAKL